MSPAKPRVAYEDSTLRVGVVENLTIAVWFDAPSADQMRTVDRVDKAMRRASKGGVGFLNVIVSGVPTFSAEVREEAARQVAEGNDNNACAGHLILIEGFVGVAVRAFLSTVFLMAKPDYPTKIFAEPRLCARWMAESLDGAGEVRWTKERMELAIDALIHPPGT